MTQTADSTAENSLHIAIIGSGTAGMACAEKAIERGARVTLIEHHPLSGPGLASASIAASIRSRAAQIAHLRATSPFDAAIAPAASSVRPDALLDLQYKRVAILHERWFETLRRCPQFKLVEGEARFLDEERLIVRLNDDSRKVSFRKIPFDRCLIASGTIADLPQIPGLGDTPYWTVREALSCPTIPPRLVVIGSSAVALELAQGFARLGSKVTIVARDTLFFGEEPAIDNAITQAFAAEEITVQSGTPTRTVSYENGDFVIVTDRGEMHAERLLVATGCRPNTYSLCLDMLGVALSPDGHVLVDDRQTTSVAGIYAAGGCADMPRFPDVAAAAGQCAAINMTGGNTVLDVAVTPSVVFTDPQMATVGLSEAEAHAQGIETVSRTLSLDSVPRALVNFDTCGFIRMVAEAGSLRLLGVQAVSPEAGELIQTAAIAMRACMTVQDLAGQLFPGLTMVEGLKLCAQAFINDVQA